MSIFERFKRKKGPENEEKKEENNVVNLDEIRAKVKNEAESSEEKKPLQEKISALESYTRMMLADTYEGDIDDFVEELRGYVLGKIYKENLTPEEEDNLMGEVKESISDGTIFGKILAGDSSIEDMDLNKATLESFEDSELRSTGTDGPIRINDSKIKY